MDTETLNRILRAFAIAAIVTVVFVTAITIIADLYLPLKDWLKATFSHHWLGKGAIAGMLFLASGLSLLPVSRREIDGVSSALRFLSWTAVLGALALIAFFTIEAFHLL